MKEDPQRIGWMQKFLVIFVTAMLMMVCGVGAFVMSMQLLMKLGTKHHDNYEYYGQTPAVALIFAAGTLGFVAPGAAVWYLRNRQLPWQFSLRTLLIGMTIVAALLGVLVWAVS